MSDSDKQLLIVDIITNEALKTSEIEGEFLNRDSVQSSLRKNFGIDADDGGASPAERGIANMMTDLYRNYSHGLNHKTLHTWHAMLMSGRSDIQNIGHYRTHHDPMQVVSGSVDGGRVHFEAPPSTRVKREMDRFIEWYRANSTHENLRLPALTHAGLTHLYFVCIHPFEDGNGRIGRALAEKSLSQSLGQPTLIALSQVIEQRRSDYYNALERNNRDLEITEWLLYFADTILAAQQHSMKLIDFLIEKAKLFDRVRGALNKRQEKVIQRMFREGLEGFEGGLSADNYISITGTSRATATRDLKDLVEKKVFVKTGTLKSTRYHLNIRTG